MTAPINAQNLQTPNPATPQEDINTILSQTKVKVAFVAISTLCALSLFAYASPYKTSYSNAFITSASTFGPILLCSTVLEVFFIEK